MKKIFKYLLLSIALMGIVSACDILNPVIEPADLGLGIKVFFPTKVVKGQPMTINGSGFKDVTEIEFPDGVRVTDFEIVSNDMIRVTAPAGIAAEGGKIIVRTADEQAESPLPLTLGKTVVSGFSKQAGEEIEIGEQLTIYGTDLEFINGIELLDKSGNPFVLSDASFQRKGTSSVVVIIPKNVQMDTFTGKVFTYDGQEILMPELTYKPSSGGGHWETQEIPVWETETPFADWSATIVIGPENFTDVKEGAIVRVYTKDKNGDYNPIFKHVDDWSDWGEFQGAKVDEDDYFEAPVPASAIAELQAKGLRFQGIGFTIAKVVLIQDVWIDGGGGGHWEHQENTIWDQETEFADWSATIAIPADMFADAQEGAVIRVLISGKGDDYNPIFKHVDDWSDWTEFQSEKVDEDGYFEAPIPAGALDELKAKGLRFQGIGFTITKVILIQDAWVDGGGNSDPVVIWDQETVFADWSATIAIPADMFADAKEGDVVRVYISGKGDDYNPIFKHMDDWSDWTEFQSAKADEDGYFEAPIPAGALDELKAKGLRFQGIGFTITKVELVPQGGGNGGNSGPAVIWDTETVFADWSATIVIESANFANVKEGNTLRVHIKDKGDDYNPIFKHVDDWSDWTEFQSNKVDEDGYFEAPVPAEAIAELQTSGLRFQGIGFTITKVELIP